MVLIFAQKFPYPDKVSCLYAFARRGSIDGDVLPIIRLEDAFGAIASVLENLFPDPFMSGASPRSLPSFKLVALVCVLMCLKIRML